MLLDPLRMAITFQIFKSSGITAKTMAMNLGIHRNTVYYHLKKLVRAGIVTSREEPVPKKHFPQKIYRISDDFLALKQSQSDNQEPQSIPNRLLLLANLYETSALIMEAANFVNKLEDEQFESFSRCSSIYAQTFLLSKPDYQDIMVRMDDLLRDIQKLSEINTQDLVSKRLQNEENNDSYCFLSILGVPPLSIPQKD